MKSRAICRVQSRPSDSSLPPIFAAPKIDGWNSARLSTTLLQTRRPVDHGGGPPALPSLSYRGAAQRAYRGAPRGAARPTSQTPRPSPAAARSSFLSEVGERPKKNRALLMEILGDELGAIGAG